MSVIDFRYLETANHELVTERNNICHSDIEIVWGMKTSIFSDANVIYFADFADFADFTTFLSCELLLLLLVGS